MGETSVFVIDCSVILLLAIALWLSVQRHAWAAVLLGVVGLATMSAITALRAYPTPTRASLGASIASLSATVDELTKQKRQAELTMGQLTNRVHNLEEQIRGEKSKRQQIQNETAARLRDMMSTRLCTNFYEIKPLADVELINGKRGTYYSIRLTEEKDVHFVFLKGQYRLSKTSEHAIQVAINHLFAHVIEALTVGTKAYEIFIRGGADAEPWDPGQLPPEHSTLSYRPREGDAYGPKLSDQIVQPPITNAHLPLLRAAYFHSLIAGRGGTPEMDILHNRPASIIADGERTVELILFVDW